MADEEYVREAREDSQTLVTLQDGRVVKLAQLLPTTSVDQIRDTLGRIRPGWLAIRTSHVPGAGDGLYADRNFQRHELITFYDGPVINFAAASLLPPELRTHARTLRVGVSLIIGNVDAATLTVITRREQKLGKGGGAFLNDAWGSPYDNNCEYYLVTAPVDDGIYTRFVAIRALRDIAAGEELFVSYGEPYWKRAYSGPNGDGDGDFSIEKYVLPRDQPPAAAPVVPKRRIAPTPLQPPTPLPSVPSRPEGADESEGRGRKRARPSDAYQLMFGRWYVPPQ